jgi:hypothetical protein
MLSIHAIYSEITESIKQRLFLTVANLLRPESLRFIPKGVDK